MGSDYLSNKTRGFLPNEDPLRSVKNSSQATNLIANISSELPKLLLTNKIRPTIDKLDKDELSFSLDDYDQADLNLLFAQLSFVSHAYVWGDLKPIKPYLPVLLNLGSV